LLSALFELDEPPSSPLEESSPLPEGSFEGPFPPFEGSFPPFEPPLGLEESSFELDSEESSFELDSESFFKPESEELFGLEESFEPDSEELLSVVVEVLSVIFLASGLILDLLSLDSSPFGSSFDSLKGGTGGTRRPP
jgi:hypothetical protein